MSKLIAKKCFSFSSRSFSKSIRTLKHYDKKRYRHVRYPNIYQEPVKSERTPFQRLSNTGVKMAPYDKNFPVTGKNTGPAVDGGSSLALDWAAMHKVEPTGFVNSKGQFMKQKGMVPHFVVPDLTNCELKPYVPYSTVPHIDKGEHTARELFDKFYADKIKDEFYISLEEKKQQKEKLAKTSTRLLKKKS